MFLSRKFETNCKTKEDCINSLTRYLNLLSNYLKDDYKGVASLDVLSISLDWNEYNNCVDLDAYIIFTSSTFSCTAEFDEFYDRFKLFVHNIEIEEGISYVF